MSLAALSLLCAAAADLPGAADLRPKYAEFGLTAKSQGGRGCCSLFAMNGVLEFELALAGGHDPARLSEEYLNWASHRSNGRTSDGSFFSDALAGINLFGVCEESLMPYAATYDAEAEPSEEARADAARRSDVAGRWIKRWNVKTGMSERMLLKVRRQLASGHPVAVGMRWPKQVQFDENHVLAVPPPEEVFDGHSIVLVGYKDDPEMPGGGVFTFRNSSGSDWRDAGHAYLPYAYVAAYGNDALGLRVDACESPCTGPRHTHRDTPCP